MPTVKEDGTIDTNDPYYMYSKSNLTITGEEGKSADEIKKSVGKYGGFYIAKYEAGIEGTTENYLLPTKTDIATKPLSQAGKGVWNYISRTDAITVAASMVNTEDGVKSGLISGECWDTTLQWIVNASTNKENEPNLGYDTNSAGKGWYSDVSYDTSTSSYSTHTTGYYAVNNIYDMAGNVWDWTTENCTYNGESWLVIRGGSRRYSGSDYAAAGRGANLGDAILIIGFRVVLYK